MNKDRLIDLAEWCEAGCPERNGVVGFDMSDYEQSTSCGNVCCLAGAACYFYGASGGPGWIFPAAKALGLSFLQADELFIPDVEFPFAEITPAMAARTLRHLVETGEVRWEHLQD